MELCDHFLSFSETILLYSLQAWALFFSILTLWVALSAGRILFSAKDRYGILLYSLFICVFPGIVFFASRITNEVPALFFTVSLLVLLLRWWHTPDWRWLIGVGVVFALSFITKVSAIVLLPAAVLILFLRQETLRVRIRRVLAFSLVVVALAGWYPTLRLVVETNRTKTLSFGNDQMNSAL
jgi:4-amino-4-deoxy-L-arabinose transferase-like glycosyltransferase